MRTFSVILFIFIASLSYIKAQQDQRIEAVQVFSQIDQSGNYTQELSIADLNVLPMGMSRTLNNVDYAVAISGIVTMSDHVKLTVFGRVKIPQKESDGGDRMLFFGAQDIRMSYDGNIIGEAVLSLLGDVSIPINGGSAMLTLKGNYDPNVGQGEPQTAFQMDCQGFKSLAVEAVVEFPETFIKPVNEQGKVLPGRVAAGFRTIVSDWNDLIIGIDLPAFEISGLDGFTIRSRNAVFDFSDTRNDDGTVYPAGYREKYMVPGFEQLWRGIYISRLRIDLPEQFSSKDSKRAGFETQNMILDNNGISGLFSALNVLSADMGDAGGWRFSVDRFSLSLEANQLTGAGFGGIIGLPIAKTDMGYDAFISPDNEYFLKVNPMNDLQFDLWKAHARLHPNSYVNLAVKDGKFHPEAMLHGSVTLTIKQGDASKSIADLDSVTFRSMHLQTVAPYFTVKQFGYSGEAKIKGFPLSIGDIQFSAGEKEASLAFTVAFALGKDPFSLEAGTRLMLVSEMTQEEGRHHWRYKECNLSAINIDVSVAEVFTIKGSVVIMNDDPVYGDGFAGNLTVNIQKGMKLEVSASAMFGYKDFRYWLVDGRVSFSNGILVYPPALKLTGFGGGVYYRMKPGEGTSNMPTGCNYVPDEETSLGLKAAILFCIGSDKAVNGEASFEISFNRHGGLNFIGLFGQAKVLAEIPGVKDAGKFVGEKFQKLQDMENKFTGGNAKMAEQLEKMKLYEPDKAASKVYEASEKLGEVGFTASIGIKYDFRQNSLHANFDLYINAAGGILRGAASGNRAGWAVMHIDPDEWYMHMGTPTDQLGIIFDLAGLVRIQTGSYFMVGQRIPASPPPPPEVANLLGVDAEKLDYMRDLNSLGDGRGFAFGSNIKIETGDLTFLILYANFKAGLGFDIMLKDYGETQCKGRSGVIGIDGWYANGQAYAYFQGEMGVNVNLLFVKKKIPILKGGAAALMQAKLPNPAWFAGYLGAEFDLLGGLVKGKMRMKIELGEECVLVVPGSSPLDVEVIADMTPRNGAGDIDVFAAPQVAFNMKIGHAFEVEDDEGIKKYRLKLEEFSVSQDGKTLEGKITWNSNKDIASFYSHEILPPHAALQIAAKVSFEEFKGGNWVMVYTAGKKAEERRDVSFTTGDAPDVIPPQNIEYAYPVLDQRYFYPGESDRGYVQLKRGQSYLFAGGMTHRIRMTKEGHAPQSVVFTYGETNKRIEYTLPSLDASSSYLAEIISFSANSGNTAGDTERRTAVFTADGGDEVTVRSAQAGSEIRSDAGKVLLAYRFGVSRYRTFADKVNGIGKNNALWGKVSSDVINLQYGISGGEPFDLTELTGSKYTADMPLVSVEAVLTDLYFTQQINPLLYADYPQAPGIAIAHREPSEWGIPPAKAIYAGNSYLTEVEQGNFSQIASRYFPYIYNLPQAYKGDFIDLEKQAVNRYVNVPSPKLLPLVQQTFPFIPSGDYRIKLQYVMPGEVNGTQTTFDYHNPIL
ncbi:MAG: hypothetical protein LBG28_11795 [Tannerella sp.]|nr:hypothetical protein [Tannerella sp.]